MIEAIIFDIGNVLLRFDFTVALRKIRPHCRSDISMEAFEPVRSAYEGGQLDREEFQRQIVALLNYTGTIDDLVSAYQEIFTENHEMTDLARRLAHHYPLYLLSNTNDLHIDYIFRTYPVFKLFRDAVYSYNARVSKPDPAIFDVAARQFAVDPATTLYIDDLEANVEAARTHGFKAIQYDYARHHAFEAELDQLGVRR